MRFVTQRCRKSRALWLSLALQLALSLQPSFGLTLCLADDGHATFELSHAELPCTNDLRRHHPGEQRYDADELEHHSCRDIPILETRSYRPSNVAPPLVPPLVLGAPPRSDVPAPPQAFHSTNRARCPCELSSRFLRSVILLI